MPFSRTDVRNGVEQPWKTLYPPRFSDISGKQETVSEGHKWPPPKGKVTGDRGGPFFTTKSYVGYLTGIRSNLYSDPGFDQHHFYGDVLAFGLDELPLPFPPSAHSSEDDMNQAGAEAIARCSPYNSVTEASTFLSEALKEGLPSLPGVNLWEKRTRAYLGVADEFLNTVFGWLPLVSDIKDTVTAARHASEVLKQFVRDNGRDVRRTYYFPKDEQVEESVVPGIWNATFPGAQLFRAPAFAGVVTRRRVTTRKKWFSGCFTYHIPADSDSLQAMLGYGSQADKLLGTTLDPQTLWELTPWSWTIDWFSNASEVITNFQNFEIGGLVMRYGYMMEESIVEDTYTMSGGSGLFSQGKEFPLSLVSPVTLITKTKQRIPANPYGFGISWESLSTLQYAILTALGITKSR
jgi:hypothetical protein